MQSIGPYRLDGELGRGAMGIVFRAFDPAIGRPVAIKVILLGQFSTGEEKAELKLRLGREAAAAGRLAHPNIVTVYHLGEHDSLPYIVLELVKGPSLEESLGHNQPQDPKVTISVLSQVADALDYAHGEGIVHRDIKPANILVRLDGKVKITDFGIARIVSETITASGVSMGTPAYMAPEQIMSGKVSGASDQFSLGVIAYRMLSGEKPFKAGSLQALMMKIVSENPPPAHTHNSALSSATSEALSQAMAKEPDRRFLNCAEFVRRLSETLEENKPPSPRPDPAPVTPRSAAETLKLAENPWRFFGLCAVGWLVVAVTINLPLLATHVRVSPDDDYDDHLFPWLLIPILSALLTWLTGGWTMTRALPLKSRVRPYVIALAWGSGAAIAQVAWVSLGYNAFGLGREWELIGLVQLAYAVFMEATTRRVERIRSVRRRKWRTIIRGAFWFSSPFCMPAAFFYGNWVPGVPALIGFLGLALGIPTALFGSYAVCCAADTDSSSTEEVVERASRGSCL